jgi:cytochrome c55X
MRKTGYLCCGVAAAVLATGVALAAPSKQRQDQLIYQLRQDCGSCHGMTLKGGLGPPLVPAAVAGKSDEILVEVILHGLPGTPMGPWAFEISREEAAWLVRRMKEGL